MPILRLLQGSPYGPHEIETLTTAYAEALRLLNVWDRTSPVAESIARRTIALLSSGEADPSVIARAVAKEFTLVPSCGAPVGGRFNSAFAS